MLQPTLTTRPSLQTALADEKIARFLEKTGGALRKSIVVKNKLVNLIVK